MYRTLPIGSLLWSFLRQGMIHGLAAGALGGSLMGALLAIELGRIAFATATTLPLSPLVSLLDRLVTAGLGIFISVGEGALVGGLLGLPIGMIASALIGLLTRLFFLPLRNIAAYRTVVGLSSIGLSVVCTLMSIQLVFRFEDSLSLSRWSLLPTLGVAVYSWSVSQQIATWAD